jgi:hypothetical protein
MNARFLNLDTRTGKKEFPEYSENVDEGKRKRQKTIILMHPT